jgi:hypothetical protein
MESVSDYQTKILSPDLWLQGIVILEDSVETIALISTQFKPTRFRRRLIVYSIKDYKEFQALYLYIYKGARGVAVVEALRYKPEGRGIDSRGCD